MKLPAFLLLALVLFAATSVSAQFNSYVFAGININAIRTSEGFIGEFRPEQGIQYGFGIQYGLLNGTYGNLSAVAETGISTEEFTYITPNKEKKEELAYWNFVLLAKYAPIPVVAIETGISLESRFDFAKDQGNSIAGSDQSWVIGLAIFENRRFAAQIRYLLGLRNQLNYPLIENYGAINGSTLLKTNLWSASLRFRFQR